MRAEKLSLAKELDQPNALVYRVNERFHRVVTPAKFGGPRIRRRRIQDGALRPVGDLTSAGALSAVHKKSQNRTPCSSSFGGCHRALRRIFGPYHTVAKGGCQTPLEPPWWRKKSFLHSALLSCAASGEPVRVTCDAQREAPEMHRERRGRERCGQRAPISRRSHRPGRPQRSTM